jgi:hypothetical protein
MKIYPSVPTSLRASHGWKAAGHLHSNPEDTHYREALCPGSHECNFMAVNTGIATAPLNSKSLLIIFTLITPAYESE